MRINLKASEIRPGDTLNLETVEEVKANGEGQAVWVRTTEDGWHEPYKPDFRVNVTR